MRRTLLALSALAALVAAAPRTRHPEHPALRTLFLGDSYTIGEGVPPAAGWPEQLVARWRARGLAADTPVVIARTGWTTQDLYRGIQAAQLQGTFDLVALLIGVNNQFRELALDDYRTDFSVLLAQAVDFAGGQPSRVAVLSIPDWSVTPFAADRDGVRIAAEIDRFNAAARERTLRVGAHWVDVTALSRAHGADPHFLAGDALHPSAAAYAEWARAADDSLHPASRTRPH